MGYSLQLAARDFFYMHQRRNRMVHTIDFVIPVVEKWREKEMGPLGGICQIHSGVELCAEYIYIDILEELIRFIGQHLYLLKS